MRHAARRRPAAVARLPSPARPGGSEGVPRPSCSARPCCRANTLVPAWPMHPADLKVSGKFTTPGKRVEAGRHRDGSSRAAARPASPPPSPASRCRASPASARWATTRFIVLTDNGFGAKANLAGRDAVLPQAQDRLYRRQDRAHRDHLPARSRQEGAVPHRPTRAPRSAT